MNLRTLLLILPTVWKTQKSLLQTLLKRTTTWSHHFWPNSLIPPHQHLIKLHSIHIHSPFLSYFPSQIPWNLIKTSTLKTTTTENFINNTANYHKVRSHCKLEKKPNLKTQHSSSFWDSEILLSFSVCLCIKFFFYDPIKLFFWRVLLLSVKYKLPI